MKDKIKILNAYLHTKYGKGFKSRNELEAWQHKKVISFLNIIVPLSPFYRNYYKGLSFNNWSSFPTIDKSIMMDNFTTLNTLGLNREESFEVAFKAEINRDFSPMLKDITIGLSSGTSGNRGLFIASKEERLKWAGTILAKVLPNTILSSNKVAFFLRANSNLYTTVEGGRIKFQFFDLLCDIDNLIQKLNAFSPTILVAPPSMLRLLAKGLEEKKLKLNPIKIISVAEVLDPLDEIYIRSQFKQQIHQIYQCTEGFLATTCSHGTLHLNEDLLVIQKDYIDRTLGKFSPIITDFSRSSQPILRYKLNDILTERKSPCPCGSIHTAIDTIEGRCDDMFYLYEKNTSKLIPVFPDFIRRAIISSSDYIREYKVIQKEHGLFEIYIDIPKEHQSEVSTNIIQSFYSLFDKLHCEMPCVKFIDEIENIPGKKLRRVERQFEVT